MEKYIYNFYYTLLGYIKSFFIKTNTPYIIKNQHYPNGIICIYIFDNIVFLYDYNEFYSNKKELYRYTKIPYKFLGKHIKLNKILHK